MKIDANTLKTMISAELEKVQDDRIVKHIRERLIEPTPAMRDWDYGAPGQQYLCWTIFHPDGEDTGIVFSEYGCGPCNPWGLMFLVGGENRTSMGMDSGWFTTFMDAFFDSFSPTNLPIWRVFAGRDPASPDYRTVSPEGSWEATWQQIEDLRISDPNRCYSCDTNSRNT